MTIHQLKEVFLCPVVFEACVRRGGGINFFSVWSIAWLILEEWAGTLVKQLVILALKSCNRMPVQRCNLGCNVEKPFAFHLSYSYEKVLLFLCLFGVDIVWKRDLGGDRILSVDSLLNASGDKRWKAFTLIKFKLKG